MRRIRSHETLHGTGAGQLAIDAALADRYGLTERESICAALVKQGYSVDDIARRLEISPSTAEKHVLGLRRKLGVATTREAAVALLREVDESTARIPDAFGVVLPVAGSGEVGDAAGIVPALREAGSLQGMLDRLQEELRCEGVEALFYTFLPLAAASYRKGNVIRRHSAPPDLLDAFRSDRGRALAAMAARLFDEPDRTIALDMADEDEEAVSGPLREVCRRRSLRHAIGIGSPFGPGYVSLTAIFRAPAPGRHGGPAGERGKLLRQRLVMLQNLAYSFGALAQSADLSVREREALARIAAGETTQAAARSLGTSERALSQVLKSARTKLRADTTAEAVATAMALNALVFL